MTKSEILDTAKKIVTGHREQEYGNAEDNFGKIGILWTDYLGHLITAEDVANMMILFKVARNKTGTGKADNWIDIAGYAACGCEIATESNATKPAEEDRDVLDHEISEYWIDNSGIVSVTIYDNGIVEVDYLGEDSSSCYPYVEGKSKKECYNTLLSKIREAESTEEAEEYKTMLIGLVTFMALHGRKKEDDVENH